MMLDPTCLPSIKLVTGQVIRDALLTPKEQALEELAAQRSPYVVPKGTALLVTMDAVAAVMDGSQWQRKGWAKITLGTTKHAWMYGVPDRECPVMVVSLEPSAMEPGVDNLVYIKCQQYGLPYPTLPACVGHMEESVRFQVVSLVGLTPAILDQIYVHINRDRMLCLDWPPTLYHRDEAPGQPIKRGDPIG